MKKSNLSFNKQTNSDYKMIDFNIIKKSQKGLLFRESIHPGK